MKIFKVITFVLVLLSISCSKKEIKNVISVEQIQMIPDVKLSLKVYLDRRIEHEMLDKIADELYSRYNGKDYKNTFIIYLLYDMEEGTGAYATSHFNPEKDLQIFGLTESEMFKMASHFPINKRSWVDDHSGIIFSIEKEKDGKYYRKSYGRDLSKGSEELIRKVNNQDTLYFLPDSPSGDFYSIDKDNNLSVNDDRGHINSFLKY